MSDHFCDCCIENRKKVVELEQKLKSAVEDGNEWAEIAMGLAKAWGDLTREVQAKDDRIAQLRLALCKQMKGEEA